MILNFKNKRIKGILSILPSKTVYFKDEIKNYNFSLSQSLKLAEIMGYNKRRIVDKNTSISDLCIFGFNYLFRKKLLKKKDIDALILITQTPDYFLPPTSNVIAGKINLSEDVLCLDINQGCAGYEIGLVQAFLLLEQKNIFNVALVNADVLSKKVSRKDRNSRPIVGDGASITIIGKDKKFKFPTDVFIKMDGKKFDSLIIPAGGFKNLPNDKTKKPIQDKYGNTRSKEDLVMKGDDIFNFVMTKVPIMIKEVLTKLKFKTNKFDYYFFHQPNKFILKKLADKIKVPYKKMPNNIVENFGNGSSITVPLNICYNLGDKACKNRNLVCLGGFGVGLTWSMISCYLDNLKFCKTINHKK